MFGLSTDEMFSLFPGIVFGIVFGEKSAGVCGEN
jgi:hypothetical protein